MHFFIDHSQLSNQTSSDCKFGPDSTNPNTVFNLSTQFQLTTEARVYACEKGHLIVQKNNQHSDLVNVIIKPLTPTRINGVTVRYYFYRGIKLTSFFTLSGSSYIVNPKNSLANTEFINYFWKRLQANGTDTNSDKYPGWFGYGDNDLPITNEDSLTGERALQDIFNNKIRQAKPCLVEEGMWIGTFTNSPNVKISFEIELESELGLPSTLETCRNSTITVQTDNLSGLALKRKKEKILAYIDPAAFFGMYSENGVDTKTASADAKSKKKDNSLYTNILSKFANKNRVYLDIRNENGFSYNFYDTYQISSINLSNIRLNGANEISAVKYETDGWPIRFLDTVPNNYKKNNENKLSLRLCVNDNINPVLYLESKNFDEKREKQWHTNIVDTTTSNSWTKDIQLYFPNARNTNKDNIANYIKLYYYVGNPVQTSTNRLLNEKYYSMPFCSIDLGNLGDITLKNGRIENPNPVYIKERLQNDGTGNFSYAAQSGAYWDNTKILFYCKSINKESFSGKRYINTFKRKLPLNNTKYNSELGNEFFTVCKKYQTTTGELKILGLNSYHLKGVLQEKEDLLLLGLGISEIQALKTVSGLSPHHPRFIYLEKDHNYHLCDTQGYRYYRYLVKVQGLNLNGIPKIVSPTFSVVVYSRDNMFFHSQSFAANENYSSGNNEIEFSIFGDNGHIYINDNIDLSLVRKKIVDVNGLTMNNINTPSCALIDDNAIPNDTSVVQQIHYLYYQPIRQPTEICRLDVIMEYQRKSSTPTGAEATASSDADFMSLGYARIFDYTAFNNFGVDAKFSYRNNNGDIIVRGKKDRNNINIKYPKEVGNKKIFMVYVNDNLINGCTLTANKFIWNETVRLFARPDLLAVFLGALVDISSSFLSGTTNRLQCLGFAYPDASCFPSHNHVNGQAFDTWYFMDNKGDNIGGTTENDRDYIRAIHKYGVGLFRVGNNPAKTALRNLVSDLNLGITCILDGNDIILHRSHLHTENIKVLCRY